MNTSYLLRNVKLNEKSKAILEKKIAKLDKFFNDDATASVSISKVNNDREKFELTINHSGKLFRSEVVATSATKAIDKAIDVITKQILRNKSKLITQMKDGAFEQTEDIEIDQFEDNMSIVRKKDFILKPMMVEDAILQMNLLDHSFFVFEDSERNEVSVVYKRADGTYGLIETK